ncbi:MAG TPA: D-hexose-6-phosphate mutarotase [Rhodocyclaceae bacterium]|nr:D-hexose-6-phosphate mutarotase [Rhodocyclaceae bacterium]
MSTGLAEITTFNGMPAIYLRTPDGSEATVLLHGAHVVSWKPGGGEERLYLSEKAIFEEGKAVRGGIPVIFPQFSNRGPLPGHGFARNLSWQHMSSRAMDDTAIAVFQLTDSEITRAIWPHAFNAEISVAISNARLDVELAIENTGKQAMSFTAALHTYLRVAEVEEIELEGLHGQRYYDNVKGIEKIDSGVMLSIDREVDRIYFASTKPLLLRERRRALGIHGENMPDVVVWNPWKNRDPKFSDMPDSGFRRMLCVEAAVIDKPVCLSPQASWWGRQTLVALG